MTVSRAITPGQTIGPFFGYALPYPGGPDLVPAGRADAIRLHGVVYDGHGDPVPDALLEVWQPDPAGRVVQLAEGGSLRRDGWTFTGWGRSATDDTGHYSFATLRPGAMEPGKLPFFAVALFARGLTHRLFTRAYLPADESVITADTFLSDVPSTRRKTLFATPEGDGFAFDIHLQGEDETVFLTFPGHGEQ
jgi:protocatechuate 3,4-dioxygenase alpha subunit